MVWCAFFIFRWMSKGNTFLFLIRRAKFSIISYNKGWIRVFKYVSGLFSGDSDNKKLTMFCIIEGYEICFV